MTPTQRDGGSPTDESGATLAKSAADADNAVIRLAHQLASNPAATPADVDVILAHLANTVATLPQVSQRLALVLDRPQSTWELSMDEMTSTTDPDVAVATARAHLDALDQPLRETYRHLNAARNEAAHIRANPPEDYDQPTTRSRPRPEERDAPHSPAPRPRRPHR